MKKEFIAFSLLAAVAAVVAPRAAADETLECKLTRPDGTTQTIACPPMDAPAGNADQTQSDKYAKFIADAQNTLAQLLKDPDSAKWRDVYAVGTDGQLVGICGGVLAKNSYGAYTGWKLFVGQIRPRPEIVIESTDETSRLIIGAAYNGLKVTWGGDGQTIFGGRTAVYQSLLPFDGYCRHRLTPSGEAVPVAPSEAVVHFEDIVVPIRSDLQPGDVILAIVNRGTIVQAITPEQVNNLLASLPRGSSVTLRLSRGGVQRFSTIQRE